MFIRILHRSGGALQDLRLVIVIRRCFLRGIGGDFGGLLLGRQVMELAGGGWDFIVTWRLIQWIIGRLRASFLSPADERISAGQKSMDLGYGVVDQGFTCSEFLLTCRDGVFTGVDGVVHEVGVGADLPEVCGRGTNFAC
jgi:hypothetical protein